MWLMILPMMLITVLIPFLLLAKDMRIEQNSTKGLHFAQMLKIYHEATVEKISRHPPPGGTSWIDDVKLFLPSNIKNGPFWMQTTAGRPTPIDSALYKNGSICEVISFLKTTENTISLENASSIFSKLWGEQRVSRAGIYNFDTNGFVDFSGVNISLINFQVQLPRELNGIPVMYTKTGC